MSSFEARFYRENPSFFARLSRDVALLVWIAQMLWAWFVPGLRIRKAYRKAERTGEPLVLEEVVK